MNLFINELSFKGQVPSADRGLLVASGLLDLIVSFRKLPKSKEIFSHSELYAAQVTGDLTLVECLRRLRQTDTTTLAYGLIAQGPYADRLLVENVPQHSCLCEGDDVAGSSLAGAAYLSGCVASIPDADSLSRSPISVQFSEDGNEFRDIQLQNFTDSDVLSDELRLKCSLTQKHDVGGWGTPMDLDLEVAEHVLNCGIVGSDGRQVYGFHEGRLFVFQSDNTGYYHGYPVAGTEVPAPILRAMRDADFFNQSEYERFLRQGPERNKQ